MCVMMWCYITRMTKSPSLQSRILSVSLIAETKSRDSIELKEFKMTFVQEL